MKSTQSILDAFAAKNDLQADLANLLKQHNAKNNLSMAQGCEQAIEALGRARRAFLEETPNVSFYGTLSPGENHATFDAALAAERNNACECGEVMDPEILDGGYMMMVNVEVKD
jgi:hypothetical protein